MSRDKPRPLTKHHVLCSSRGGTNTYENIKMLPDNIHEAFHHLFANLTPEEIIVYLTQEFFNNKEYVSAEKWKRANRNEEYKQLILKWQSNYEKE